jgi:ubiquinone/menaquinone biosynthesis C-methylase UbiE
MEGQLKQLLRVFPQCHTPPRALEAGCGDGRITTELARLGWEATGVDVEPLRVARNSHRYQNIPRLRFVWGDMRNLQSLAEGYFCAVVIAHALHMVSVSDYPSVARAVGRICHEGALLLILDSPEVVARFLDSCQGWRLVSRTGSPYELLVLQYFGQSTQPMPG